MFDHHVKLVAMHDLVALTVSCLIDATVNQSDVAKYVVTEIAQKLIVVARQISHCCAFACLPQYLLYHIVVCLWPIEVFTQCPTIHYVAN